MSTDRIACPSGLNQETGRGLFHEVRNRRLREGQEIVLDFAATEKMDSQGGAWLIEIADWVRRRRAAFRCEGQRGQVADFLELIGPCLSTGPVKRPRRPGALEHLGDTAYRVKEEMRDFVNLLIDAVYWTILGPLTGRGFRWGLFMDELYQMGVRAVRINVLMNFLLGLTIAMLSDAQLRNFGVSIWVADLIMIGFARELAAVMTAVVVSARTGAAITAEIATMQVQEEIDALRGMGLKVPQFLVAPKLLALIIVLPCLTAMGMLAGIGGGAAWGVLVLDFRIDAWLSETLYAARMGDIIQGMVKSFFFAIVIALVGCHNGLRVRGGSRGVGLMTTRAVVMDAFSVVVIDMAFAAFFYFVKV